MPSFSRKLGMVSLGLSVAFVGCGKTSDNDLTAASGSAGKAGEAGEVGGAVQLEIGGGVNVGSAGALGGVGGMPVQPAVDCEQAGGDNAGAAGVNEECSVPPSVCADGQHLLYYSSGVCIAGKCTWTVATLPCPERCSNGACVGSTTEK